MTITASFIDGPIAGQVREIRKAKEVFTVVGVIRPERVTSAEPSSFVRLIRHCYELESARLTQGGHTHVFYSYIGIKAGDCST